MFLNTAIISISLWLLLCLYIIWSSSDKKWYEILTVLSWRPLNKPILHYNNAFFWKFTFGFVLYVLVIMTDVIVFQGSRFYVLSDAVIMLIRQIYSSVSFNMLMVFRDSFRDIRLSLEESSIDLLGFQHVKMLQKHYRENLEACDLFNDLCGKMLLLATCATSVQLLYCAHLLALLINAPEKGFFYAFTVVAGLVSMHYGLIAIFACDLVEKEAKLIFRECCKQLERTDLEASVKNDLIVFAVMVKNDFPQFTAWGFFNLRRSTILSLMNTAATYMIVSYQFNG